MLNAATSSVLGPGNASLCLIESFLGLLQVNRLVVDWTDWAAIGERAGPKAHLRHTRFMGLREDNKARIKRFPNDLPA